MISGKLLNGEIWLSEITVLKNGYLILNPPEKGFVGDLVIYKDKIVDILAPGKAKGNKTINCTNLIVCPGFVDIHAHLREPGFVNKEDILSGSYAAVSGGITTILSMPNTLPVLDSISKIKKYRKLINKKSYCRIYPICAATINSDGKKITAIEKIIKSQNIIAFSDDGFPIPQDLLEEILERLKPYKNKVKLIQHSEYFNDINKGVVIKGYWSKYLKVPGIPIYSEYKCIKDNIEILKKTNGSIHFTHISSKESLELILNEKKNGFDISLDVTPHHLFFTASRLKTMGSNAIMNPPLRFQKDIDFILKSIINKSIEIIATDHAPHTDKEKSLPIEKVPKGVIGFQTLLGAITKKLDKYLSLEEIISLITSNPSSIFNLPHGRLNIGNLADIAIIKKQNWKVIKRKLEGKSHNTPFNNIIFPYKIIYTFVNGNLKYINL